MVADERREQVEQRVARRDEEEVQRPQAEEQPVAQHLAIRAGGLALAELRRAGVADEPEHADVGEEREPVEDEQTVKDVGESAFAIRPPVNPPRPTPRFIVTRCCANAACSRAGGVKREISVDWLGQKPRCRCLRTRAARTRAKARSRAGAARSRVPG